MTTATQYKRESKQEATGNQICWESITQPGCYLSNQTGHLIRIPEDAVKIGNSPVLEIIGKEPMMVTHLSDDPFLAVSKARMMAADLDLFVNF
jgi:hypothetical protein